jgi:hypothetical protein
VLRLMQIGRGPVRIPQDGQASQQRRWLPIQAAILPD